MSNWRMKSQEIQRMHLSGGVVPRTYVVGERFLKGPIPMKWIYEAMRLKGKALHVAIELAHWSGIKSSTEIKFSCRQLKGAGISRFACYRALKELESSGLIIVTRGKGRKAIININFQSGKIGLGNSDRGVQRNVTLECNREESFQ